MRIQPHPRILQINRGDEVFSYTNQIFACVEEVFPAAVCVRVGILEAVPPDIVSEPQLWRADDIENLSVCRYCGSRVHLHREHDTGIPFRICEDCAAYHNHPIARPAPNEHQPS